MQYTEKSNCAPTDHYKLVESDSTIYCMYTVCPPEMSIQGSKHIEGHDFYE